MRDLAYALARIAIVAIFVWSGYGKLLGLAGVSGALAAKGLPFPYALAAVAAVGEIALALAVIVGFQTRIAAAGLIVFTVVATYFFHDFWTMTGEAARANQIHAMKNLALIGGLLILATLGPGRYAIGRR